MNLRWSIDASSTAAADRKQHLVVEQMLEEVQRRHPGDQGRVPLEHRQTLPGDQAELLKKKPEK